MNQEKQKYFLCYLHTGGGHLAPARSIAKYLAANYGESIESVLVDGLAHAKPFARYIIEDGYRILQAKAKWYYETIYALNKLPFIGQGNVLLAKFFIKGDLKNRIIEERPAKIAIFHFLLIEPVYEILEELGMDIPVITLVTDPFTAHPMWFKRKQKQYIVFSERLKEYCTTKRHVPPEKVVVFPFMIDEKFSAPLPSPEIAAFKKKFGFSPKRKMLLIIGGGDGIPNGKFILQQLLHSQLDVDIAIVCGKNKELHEEALKTQHQFPDLKVFGFVDFVYELLNVSDIVITKCGASTIMEILLMKKIPIINDFLWEQELGNMEFVRDNALGIFERKIPELPKIIRRLTENDRLYNELKSNIEKLHLRSGTKEVTEYLVKR
jgi:UDP-N-acetylglucosamine:LPS N-acetylglucosamine transferase